MTTPDPHLDAPVVAAPMSTAAPGSIAAEVRRVLDVPAEGDLAVQADALEELHSRLAATLATIDTV